MKSVVFDTTGLVSVAGNIRVYYFDPSTHEYVGWSDEYIHVGVSMPENSTDIAPGDGAPDSVFVFTGMTWEQYPDHRGDIVYSTADSAPVTIDYIGDVRDGFTTEPPLGRYNRWDGKKWVIDMDAQAAADVTIAENQKAQLRTLADKEIAWRNDAVDEGIATEKEAAALAEWKKYRVLLMRVNTSNAPDIEWPPRPEC